MVAARKVTVRKKKSGRSLLKRVLYILSLIFLLLLAAGLLWFGTRLESLTITEVEVIGGDTVDKGKIKTAVEAELQGSYFGVVPKRFSWVYPEEKIMEVVRAVPRVKSVLLERPDGRSLTIRFIEYSPFALWCDKVEETNCVFLDDQGFAFSSAPPLTGGALPRYFSTDKPATGNSPFSYEFLRDTSFFVTAIRKEFDFATLGIEQVGDAEAVLELSANSYLKITSRQNVHDTLDNLRVIMSSEEFGDLEPGDFNYIDLRFGDKVFVNEEKEVEDTATSTSTVIEDPAE